MKLYDVDPKNWSNENRDYIADGADTLGFGNYREAKRYAKRMAAKYDRVEIWHYEKLREDFDSQWEYEDSPITDLDNFVWCEAWDEKGQMPFLISNNGEYIWRDGDDDYEPVSNRTFKQLDSGEIVEVA